MRRLLSLLASILAAAILDPTVARVCAGGFMMPEGQAQIITGVGYIEASRVFNQFGKSVPAPAFHKTAISGFAEYGLTPGLTIIAAPTVARMQAGMPSNAYSGSDESAFGVRLELWGMPTRTLALQALFEPPLGGRSNRATELALGGPHAFATDLRLQFGQAISIFGYGGYLSLEPGFRLRGEGWPDETRFDAALGIRPQQRGLILVQGFASSAASTGPSIPRTAYAKLQLSYVYDLSPAWSIQIGGLRTLFGRNTARETGPLAGLWHRF